jgi:hypothetical protein
MAQPISGDTTSAQNGRYGGPKAELTGQIFEG